MSFCKAASDYTVRIGNNYDLNIVNVIVASILFISQVSLLFVMTLIYRRAFSIKSIFIPLESLYYVYFQVVCFWFFLEGVALILPSKANYVSILLLVLWGAMGFFDNIIIVLLLFKKNTKIAIFLSFFIAIGCAGSYLGMLGYFHKSFGCSWCGLYMPLPEVIYNYFVFGCIYSVILAFSLCCHFKKIVPKSWRKFAPRPAIRGWLCFLITVYFGACTGILLLMAWRIDFGYCIELCTVALYNTGYVVLLYRTLIVDSQYLHRKDTERLGIHLVSEQLGGGHVQNALLPDKLANDFAFRALVSDPSVQVIAYESIILGERIGIGGYGEVFKGTWNGSSVAVKKLFTEENDQKEEFIKETVVLSKLRHPNIVYFLGLTLEPNCIITELIIGGNLFDLINKRKDPGPITFSPSESINLALQIAHGMAYLHGRTPPILHRDLKSPNILVDSPLGPKKVVRIADFGLARLHNTVSTMTGKIGTPQWAAPEVIREERYTEKADVWSYGVILWELITHQAPFLGKPPLQVALGISFDGLRLVPPPYCPKKLHKIMKACWAEDQDSRPSFNRIIEEMEAYSIRTNLEELEWDRESIIGLDLYNTNTLEIEDDH